VKEVHVRSSMAMAMAVRTDVQQPSIDLNDAVVLRWIVCTREVVVLHEEVAVLDRMYHFQ
jgi:hypothetical protein